MLCIYTKKSLLGYYFKQDEIDKIVDIETKEQYVLYPKNSLEKLQKIKLNADDLKYGDIRIKKLYKENVKLKEEIKHLELEIEKLESLKENVNSLQEQK